MLVRDTLRHTAITCHDAHSKRIHSHSNAHDGSTQRIRCHRHDYKQENEKWSPNLIGLAFHSGFNRSGR